MVRDSNAWNPDASYHTPSSYHSDALIAIAVAFLAVTITFTSLRFFVRGYMIRALGWDDWLILVALNSFVCQAAFLIHIALMEQKHNLEMPLALSNALEVSDDGMNFVTCTDYVYIVCRPRVRLLLAYQLMAEAIAGRVLLTNRKLLCSRTFSGLANMGIRFWKSGSAESSSSALSSSPCTLSASSLSLCSNAVIRQIISFTKCKENA